MRRDVPTPPLQRWQESSIRLALKQRLCMWAAGLSVDAWAAALAVSLENAFTVTIRSMKQWKK